MIGQLSVFGKTKVETAIERIKTFEPEEGYYFGDSGGKDSSCVKALLDMSEVKYDSHHNLTTVDAPETIYYLRNIHPDTKIESFHKTMWDLIVENGCPPTQLMRYCCKELKEKGGDNRFKILGIRWDESVRRKNNRLMVETCYQHNTRTLNPIIDWTENEVWEFLKYYNIPYNPLYDEGYKRIGCIMCPQKNKKGKIQDKARFPKVYDNYLRTFERMIRVWNEKGKPRTWKTGEQVMEWWINL